MKEMTLMTLDFGNGKVLNVEKTVEDTVIIRLSKEITDKLFLVFEDQGIPGVVGPNLHMNANVIVEKYLEKCKNKVLKK